MQHRRPALVGRHRGVLSAVYRNSVRENVERARRPLRLSDVSRWARSGEYMHFFLSHE